jgi:hypothetical protein
VIQILCCFRQYLIMQCLKISPQKLNYFHIILFANFSPALPYVIWISQFLTLHCPTNVVIVHIPNCSILNLCAVPLFWEGMCLHAAFPPSHIPVGGGGGGLWCRGGPILGQICVKRYFLPHLPLRFPRIGTHLGVEGSGGGGSLT